MVAMGISILFGVTRKYSVQAQRRVVSASQQIGRSTVCTEALSPFTAWLDEKALLYAGACNDPSKVRR